MSKHARDWALTAAVPVLAASGLGAAGIGPLAGLLAGTAPEIGAGFGAAIPELGVAGPAIGSVYGSAIPELGAPAVSGGGLLSGASDFMNSKAGDNTFRMMSLANSMNQQPQQQSNVMPMQQPPQQAQQQLSPEDQLRRQIAMQQAPFAAGAYFG